MEIATDFAAEVALPDAIAFDTASCNRSDFECAVCWGLLLKPVVAFCGHDFCSGCYIKCLDLTGQRCPMCRAGLNQSVPGVCVRLERIIADKFPARLKARQLLISKEDAEAQRRLVETRRRMRIEASIRDGEWLSWQRRTYRCDPRHCMTRILWPGLLDTLFRLDPEPQDEGKRFYPSFFQNDEDWCGFLDMLFQ